MTEELQINLAPQIIAAFDEANQLAEQAKGYASLAVAKAIECGKLLIQQKKSLGYGDWYEWIDINLPKISYDTVQRYMRLAKAVSQLPDNQGEDAAHVRLLDAATLRQAFIAVGIIPMPPKPGDEPLDPNKPWVEFVRWLDGFRLWFQRRIDVAPLENWTEEARRLLKNELHWFVELYERL